MSLDVGSIEDFIRSVGRVDGGWEMFEAQDDKIVKATSNSKANAAAEADLRTIQAAWASFAATPEGRMALQALIDRTLLRDFFPVHVGMSAEQVAIHTAYRQGQNNLVLLIVNEIRKAREEPTQQRDTP